MRTKVSAYGDFVDTTRGSPVFLLDKKLQKKKSTVQQEQVSEELRKVLELDDDLKIAYELAVSEGDAAGFWEALRRLSTDEVPARSSTVKQLPEVAKVLSSKGCKVQVEIGSVGFLFYPTSDLQAAALKAELESSSFRLLALAAFGVSGKKLDQASDSQVVFWNCGVERSEILMADVKSANLSVWPVEGVYNAKWRKVANWVNGYILHLCRSVWNCKKHILEPRLLYVGEQKPLNLRDWEGKPRELVEQRIPKDWIKKGGSEFYPQQPSFVLWCHADPVDKRGIFSKVTEVVEGLLAKFDVLKTDIADFSGIFWELDNIKVNWEKVKVLKLMDNAITEEDLDSVKELVDLCMNLQQLTFLAGNHVKREVAEKFFPGLMIN